MSIVADYAEAIVRRARVPMEPIGFEPDWADQPLRHKSYPGVVRFPLPLPSGGARAGLADCLDGVAGPASRPNTLHRLDELSGLLRHSYGLLGRRLRVNGNPDNDGRPWYRSAIYSRGTASGGGLYPCEIYLATGGSEGLLPGLYHYSTPHHSLDRLLAGDVLDRVRAALGEHQDAAGHQFLIVTVKFWKNAFKYNSFCYHVVTMDTGCLLATWQLWGRSAGVNLRPALWFDELAIDELLGLDPDAESAMAIVPIPAGTGSAKPAAPGEEPLARVERVERERSQTVIRFEQIEAVHRATITPDRPEPSAAALTAAAAVPPEEPATEPLPARQRDRLNRDLAQVLRDRRSSFGLFSGRPALSLIDLATIMDAGVTGGRLHTDVHPDHEPRLCRLAVFANHVRHLSPGAYDYRPERNALRLIPGEPVSPFLQRQYFLNNYNLEQAAAVLVVLGRPRPAIEALGERAYRMVNAEVGAVAQAVYLAAAALGVGCGAALGFDNVSVAERLGIEGTGEWPLLIIMLGHERTDQADIAYRLD